MAEGLTAPLALVAAEDGSRRLFVATPPASASEAWPMEKLRITTNADGTLGRIQVLALGQDENRELYVLTTQGEVGPTGNRGNVYKIVPARGVVPVR